MKKVFFILMTVFLSTASFAQQPMKIVYFNTFQPLSWEDKDNQMKGILIDAMNEAVLKRMGIPLSHQGFPWERAQMMVKEGEADAYITIPTPERRTYTEVSNEAIIVATLKMYARADSPKLEDLKKIKTPADMKAFAIGTYIGNGWAKKNLIDAGIEVDTVPSYDQSLQKLVAGRIDVVIGISPAIRYSIKNLELKNKVLELPNGLDSTEWRLCIGKKSPFANILPKFDETIREMRKEGKLMEIQSKYE